uniref:Major facilitator superfamily (MFS) profile domain-containing protein n=1 Tax=Laticauda laticaudata TaxID=8630 RepID=A0A8C5RKA1_LATLA
PALADTGMTWSRFQLLLSSFQLIRQFYNLTYHSGKKNGSQNDTIYDELVIGIASSLFPLGAMLGSLLVGVLVDKYGRKGTMMTNNYISLMCSMLMIYANLQHGFIFAMFSRFFIGISMGIFSSVIPMYLLETSPLNMRGSIGMVPHFFLVIGVQLAQIFAFPELLGTVEGNSVSSWSGVGKLIHSSSLHLSSDIETLLIHGLFPTNAPP